MREWDPPRSWLWVGRVLWLTVRYDHRFEPVAVDRTRLVWMVDAEGPGVATVGRLFAAVYRRNLRRAVPRLVRWFADHSSSASAMPPSTPARSPRPGATR
jgi:hypothetical protein